MTQPNRTEIRERRRAARHADLGLSAVAGTAGAAAGASSLRDRHVKQYPGRMEHAVGRVQNAARKMGVSEERVRRIARVAQHTEKGGVHAGFKTIATGALAGAALGGVKHYEDYLDVKARRAARQQAVAKMLGISKSEVGPGQYKPATQTTEGDRQALRARAYSGVRRGTGTGKGAPTARHGLQDVYAAHAAGMTENTRATFGEATTPSVRHPNIEYGASIPHSAHAELDNKINPALAAKSPHKIVLHHAPIEMPGALAGAVGAHKTTGGKGHVVLNSDVLHPNGDAHLAGPMLKQAGIAPHEVVNHELAHAAVKVSNPLRSLGPRGEVTAHTQKRNLGEEARADHASSLPGKSGIYTRLGTVADRQQVQDALKASPADFRGIVPKGLEREAHASTQATARAMAHYHRVSDILSHVKKGLTVSAFGVDHGFALPGRSE